ncbi:MAG: neutral/alkaline non-lysosomal ceramidase N-terminal domain-containing protein [Pirellulales bacterium]|nr:neutral/alkaline non-lysosomal ceramidase N-terminal domain-containing protein [Pirellulales bacterium]
MSFRTFGRLALACFVGVCCLTGMAGPARGLDVGFAEVEITPTVGGKRPVYIAGYGMNRRAKDVHDPLFARAVVLRDGETKFALVSIDVVGLQYPTVLSIRSKLTDYGYVMVSSTHNHEGPDTVGIWGPSPIASGVDAKWLASLEEKAVAAVKQAESQAAPCKATYGTASDEALLRDSREPYVFDPVLRAIKFTREDNQQLQGVLIQWNCHPESMGSENQSITADFIWATVAQVKEKLACPVAYFTGAVGGLMAPPRGKIPNAQGEFPPEGDFEFCELYGKAVGQLALKALEATEPVNLSPLQVAAKPISIPLENKLYQVARMLGIMKRNGVRWTGNSEDVGEELPRGVKDVQGAAVTEVAVIRLGDVHVACIPGELYPELIYGKYQDPVDPAADFPEAPLEQTIVGILPSDKWLLFGLANDEIGYIVPKRQWDVVAPFCYGRTEAQYGEENSIGAEAAPLVMDALARRMAELRAKP